MKYRFPRWFSYALLVAAALVIAVSIYMAYSRSPRWSIGAAIGYGALATCPTALLIWGYFYARHYGIQISTDAVILTKAFSARTIPLSLIKQVITASVPRSGADSWLIDGSDAVIAKLDGSLEGFDSLLVGLGKALQPYEALFYRRQSFGPWEMQVAGDSRWVPSGPPQMTRRSGRRLAYVMALGCALIAIAVALSWCADHGILISR
jgi:hypothetical protein